ncbi:NAD(P)/FAD-dependent oxidoreductase [Vibrio sinensis]|uniref:NAD(P)/FAD-dependent oxidoreductase n=1 Tax=Vibrio sinensis TaxID=2302434 RepID=A0A3A6QXR0_9VIBR|nr:NAD(P)/FAD-dependent oxidoreductase [Vibrio sinensis]RJX75316.1 NAD(P)/FAD-dependent oxidoreductase [Vibrio sinensis]
MANFVVVGGGAAGLELVTRLGKSFAGNKQHTVTLVEPSGHHLWKPRLHEIAVGSFDNELDAVSYVQHSVCNGYQFVQAGMSGLDRESKTIVLDRDVDGNNTLSYDYLVMAVGAVSNDFKINGVREHCLFLDSSEQALLAWEQIKKMLQSSTQQRISIVGAGATGVELASELAKLNQQLSRYKMGGSLAVTLIEAADRVLPASPKCMSEKVQRKLEQQGVTVQLNAKVQSASHHQLIVNDTAIEAQLQVWAAGVKCADWLANLDGLETNRINQIRVKPTLQTTLDDSVFVIGDNAECPQPDGSMVPPRAQAANQEATHLAKQFKRLIKDKPLQPFIFKDGGMMIALGHDYAVGSVMGNKLVLRGRWVRNIYDTIFRLHQQVLFGWGRVSALMILKRVKCLLNPYYKGSLS